MKKITLAIIILTQISMASYWDCRISYKKSGAFGAGQGDFTIEVKAKSRSMATRKANSVQYINYSSWGSSESRTVCAEGQKKHSGNMCRYNIYNISCVRQ